MNRWKFLDKPSALTGVAVHYLEAMLRFDRHAGLAAIEEAMAGGAELRDVYLQVFQPVQYEIGWLWQCGEISVGHEHYCTNSTQVIMAGLYHGLFAGEHDRGRLVAACVQGELHELGLRMLADFFEMDGWDTCYLGANTPTDAVVAQLKTEDAQLLLVGCTMHDHVTRAAELIESVRAASELPILVGGYTFSVVPDLWRQIGANGTAADAREAVELGTRLADDWRSR